MGIMVCQVFFPNQTTEQIKHWPSDCAWWNHHYHSKSYTAKSQPQLKQICTSLLTVFMDIAASHIAVVRKK